MHNTRRPSDTPDASRRGAHRVLLAAALAPLMALALGCTTPRAPVEPPAPAPVPAPAVTPPPAMVPPARALRVGLALGGGAARGFAHIGVIKVLEAQGIQVDVVAGTSAGSLVGALYASGMNGFALQQAAMTMDEATLADWSITGRGMLRGEALQAFVNRLVANRPMEQFPKPFAAVAADFSSGAGVHFTRGNAGQAVRASSSIPGVFSPVRIGTADYVDGGLVSPVPALAARQLGADFVIAVDISALPRRGEVDGLAATLNQTIAIMGLGLKAAELRQHADVVIRPEIDQVSAADFNARNQVVLAGEIAATRLLPEIRRKMDEVRKAKNLR